MQINSYNPSLPSLCEYKVRSVIIIGSFRSAFRFILRFFLINGYFLAGRRLGGCDRARPTSGFKSRLEKRLSWVMWSYQKRSSCIQNQVWASFCAHLTISLITRFRLDNAHLRNSWLPNPIREITSPSQGLQSRSLDHPSLHFIRDSSIQWGKLHPMGDNKRFRWQGTLSNIWRSTKIITIKIFDFTCDRGKDDKSISDIDSSVPPLVPTQTNTSYVWHVSAFHKHR